MTLSTEKQEEQRSECFRTYILGSSGLGMTPMFRHDEISRLRSFILTMEKFFEDSIQAEMTELEPSMRTLSADEKDLFLQYNYPIHWEENFGTRTRSAFCIQLCSHVETVLIDVAERVHIIDRCPAIKIKKHLPAIGQYRAYFEANAKFTGPSLRLWQQMNFISLMRNAFVHNNGSSNKIGKDAEFDSFLAGLPHVEVYGEFIDLKAGSCTALLDIAECFHVALYDEYIMYQKRMRELESASEQPHTPE